MLKAWLGGARPAVVSSDTGTLSARLDEDRARAIQHGEPRRWAHLLDRWPLQFALLVLAGTLVAQFLIGPALGGAVNAAV